MQDHPKIVRRVPTLVAMLDRDVLAGGQAEMGRLKAAPSSHVAKAVNTSGLGMAVRKAPNIAHFSCSLVAFSVIFGNSVLTLFVQVKRLFRYNKCTSNSDIS